MPYTLLPTKPDINGNWGGFISKDISTLTTNELKFLEVTKNFSYKSETDRIEYRRLAEELLFIEKENLVQEYDYKKLLLYYLKNVIDAEGYDFLCRPQDAKVGINGLSLEETHELIRISAIASELSKNE